MLPASIKMRPDGKLLLYPVWICHKQSGLPKAPGNRHSGIASYGNSVTLTAVCNAFGGY
jgi:hypothetical protein